MAVNISININGESAEEINEALRQLVYLRMQTASIPEPAANMAEPPPVRKRRTAISEDDAREALMKPAKPAEREPQPPSEVDMAAAEAIKTRIIQKLVQEYQKDRSRVDGLNSRFGVKRLSEIPAEHWPEIAMGLGDA